MLLASSVATDQLKGDSCCVSLIIPQPGELLTEAVNMHNSLQIEPCLNQKKSTVIYWN
jgi:hypothetical protein